MAKLERPAAVINIRTRDNHLRHASIPCTLDNPVKIIAE
jgi:hypothetical protein